MYEVVEKREDGDAAAWGFFAPDQKGPKLFYYKLLPLADDEVRIQVEWTGLC